MPAPDTTPRAAAIQLELYRQVGPSRRAQIAVELSDAVRDTALAGIRRRHPDYSEEEVALSFLRMVYGGIPISRGSLDFVRDDSAEG